MAANGSELKNLNIKYNIGHFTPDQKNAPHKARHYLFLGGPGRNRTRAEDAKSFIGPYLTWLLHV
jgi:hypothetical protein